MLTAHAQANQAAIDPGLPSGGPPKRLSDPMFQSVMDSAIDAIVVSDARGRIEWWNRAATELFGYTEQQALGQSLTLIVPSRLRERHRRGLARVAGGQPGRLSGRTMETLGLCRDGREVPIELSLSSFERGGRCYFTGIIRDISERKRAEAAARHQAQALERKHAQLVGAQACVVEQETQAALGRLAAGMLHELNSPLGALRSATDTVTRLLRHCRDTDFGACAQGAGGDPRIARTLASIDSVCGILNSGTERIAQTVDALERFAPPDGDTPRPVDVRECVEDALSVIASRLPEGIRVRRHFQEPSARVVCRAARFNQSLLALMQNAVAAMGSEGTLDVVLARRGSEVCVEIHDDGCGMSPAKVAAAQRIDFVERGGRIRLRMGLATCKAAIEHEGGELLIDSTEGAGTRVAIRFPAA